jgi:uncharacterized protein
MTNRLYREKSPYLLQHAENPVDWHPWGEEAFARATREDKPVFFSSGYSTCHWCHVMAHESFEDSDIAVLMNETFVCIKVDREERPDIDKFYMTAAQMMTGGGGWPLTILMTPDKSPFFFFCRHLYPQRQPVRTDGPPGVDSPGKAGLAKPAGRNQPVGN